MKLPRYGPGARWYDVLSLERVLYRSGRLTMIELARVRPGDRVLDIGCGTGLSFGPLVARVGADGAVVGVDSSEAMLAQARRRADRSGWSQLRLVRGDAGELSAELGTFDVVLFAYSLSIVPQWREAWRRAVALLAPGGRMGVVDTALPTGRRRVLAPFAWLYLAAGGVHPERAVWRLVDQLEDVRTATLKGGHVRLAVGMKALPVTASA